MLFMYLPVMLFEAILEKRSWSCIRLPAVAMTERKTTDEV